MLNIGRAGEPEDRSANTSLPPSRGQDRQRYPLSKASITPMLRLHHNRLLAYFVVYPPFTRIVCPVIHHPSETRKRIQGTMSSMSVRPVFEEDDNAAAVLW